MKHLLVAVMIAAVAVVATDARANNITTSTPLLLTNTWTATHTNLSPNPFSDSFTFTGSGPFLAGAFLATLGFTAGTNIDFSSATLNGTALTLSPTGVFESAITPAPFSVSAPIIILVTGTTGATGGVTNSFYNGTLTVTPVPVPEPVSLLLLGAGLAGIGIWRRKSTKS